MNQITEWLSHSQKPMQQAGLTLQAELLQKLYLYWQQHCQNGRLPKRRDFDPVEVPHFLDHMMFVQVERPAPRDYRFFTRIIGNLFNNVWKNDISRRYLDEIAPRLWTHYWQDEFVRAVEDAQCHAGQSALIYKGEQLGNYEWLILPLSNLGDEVDDVIVACCFEDIKGQPIEISDDLETPFLSKAQLP